MAQTVIGIFDNRSNAEQAVERLVVQGYDREMIDLSMQSLGSSGDLTSGNESSDGDGLGDKISKFFNNLFDDEDQSSRYSTMARTGTVVTVQTDTSEMSTRAAEVLDECGAIDVDNDTSISSDQTSYRGETSTFGASISPGTPVSSLDSVGDELGSRPNSMEEGITSRPESNDDNESRSIPVIEEDLQVGKREIERGGVRLRSRIIERPVEEHLRLREEHLTIERNATSRPASESDFNTFREGEIEVRERAEVPVVNKEARVVEEINLRKDVREREEVVRDTVRKTEVEVDKLEDSSETLISSNRKNSKSKK